jgi:hypothetical protein
MGPNWTLLPSGQEFLQNRLWEFPRGDGSIVVQSSLGGETHVDRTSCVQQGSELIKTVWVTDFVWATQDQRSLAEKTGLIAKVKS